MGAAVSGGKDQAKDNIFACIEVFYGSVHSLLADRSWTPLLAPCLSCHLNEYLRDILHLILSFYSFENREGFDLYFRNAV